MAMPGQSAADAIAGTNRFVEDNLAWSSQLIQYNQPNWHYGFVHAAHALMDSTSPAHRSPEGVPYVWRDPRSGHPALPNALYHGDLPTSKETWEGMTPELLKRNIDLIRDAWKKIGMKLDCACNE